MGLSTNTYTYTGGAQTFVVNFTLGFIQRADIKVRINGATDGAGDPVYANFEWIDDSNITVTDPLTTGDLVEVLRTVSKTELIVSFSEDADVTPGNLDLTTKQALMVYQELIDGRVEGAESPITAADRAVAAAAAAAASETNAASSEADALASENASAASASAAATSESNAAGHETASAASAAAALASEGAAATSETNASASESAAAASETASAASESAAATSETNAATSETNALNSKNAAASSASAASSSASSAAASNSAAGASETAAAASAASASSSASAASASEANASTSETNAASSASASAASASSASTSASNSAASASASASSAAASGTSATASAGSASAASTSENNAATSAAAALVSETAAAAAAVDSLLKAGGTMTGDLAFGDSNKARFGDSDNLQIYYNGSNSIIGDFGSGSLSLQTNGPSVTFWDSANGQQLAVLTTAGSNRFYYDGSKKLETVSDGISVTGNVTVTGNVDGRDVATDGTKLDGIEATADVTDTANVTSAGALMDSEVTNLAQVKAFDSSDYATAAQGAKVDGIEAGADVTDTANVTSAGALMDSELTDLAGVKALDTTDILFADVADKLTVGFIEALDNDGTQSSGTYTANENTGNTKAIVNGGAFTFAPPTINANEAIHMQVLVTNNASAGAITTSGFTKVAGDSFDTTNGNDFLCYVDVINKGGTIYSTLNVRALQ